MSLPLSILGYGYLTAEGSASPSAKLDISLLERTLRRGLSEVTRLFMHAAKLALEDAQAAPEQVQVIFASAFGEIATAEALLTEAYDANGSSPVRFRHSVHNTATGLFSISTHNQLPCTAVAAGWDTTAMALIEASAQLATDAERVLLVFAEERVPSALSSEHLHGPLAVALVLGRAGVGKRGTLSNLRRTPGASASEAALDHPLAPALALADAIERKAACNLRLGEGMAPWCVDLDARMST